MVKMNTFIYKLSSFKHPTIGFCLLVAIVIVSGVADTLMNHAELHPKQTFSYIFNLFVGAYLAGLFVMLAKAGCLYFLARTSTISIKFMNFAAGIALFSFPLVIFITVNALFTDSLFTTLPMQKVVESKSINIFLKPIISLLDLHTITQIGFYTFFISHTFSRKWWTTVILVTIVEYIFHFIAMFSSTN